MLKIIHVLPWAVSQGNTGTMKERDILPGFLRGRKKQHIIVKCFATLKYPMKCKGAKDVPTIATLGEFQSTRTCHVQEYLQL